jgi:hypothetical protein
MSCFRCKLFHDIQSAGFAGTLPSLNKATESPLLDMHFIGAVFPQTVKWPDCIKLVIYSIIPSHQPGHVWDS